MKADKGNKICIMNKNDYDECINTLFSKNSYKLSNKSPLNEENE